MPQNSQLPENSLRFRTCGRTDGGMTIWFQYCDCPEVGPIELTAAEAAELGMQAEHATRVLCAASERSSPRVREACGHALLPAGTRPSASRLRLV
ncbi:MAG: hypothetical protein RLZZ450_5714 [Pseudomonadota bacterium]|jgi:hypothetical protein